MDWPDVLSIPSLIVYLMFAFVFGVAWASLEVISLSDRFVDRRPTLQRWAREMGSGTLGCLVFYASMSSVVFVLSRLP